MKLDLIIINLVIMNIKYYLVIITISIFLRNNSLALVKIELIVIDLIN